MLDSDVALRFINEEKQPFPVFIGKNISDPFNWFKANKTLIDTYKLKYSGLLFRDFNLNSVSDFNKLLTSLELELTDYKFRSTPRTKLAGNIYTTTEYPPEYNIPLHNENSYTNSWPNQLFFFCVIAPEQGGQTPIADSRKVYDLIDNSVKKKFEETGVMYIRSFIPGIDLSWQEVFQTKNENDVNKFCRENNINYQWHSSNDCILKIKQICQASIKHPITQEKVWFIKRIYFTQHL